MEQGTASSSHRAIFATALPLMATYLLEEVVGLTDVAFLGRVGEVELGASAIAGVFFLALLMLGVGYGQGVQTHMGHRNGQRRYREIGQDFRNGLAFALAMAFALLALAQAAAPAFLAAACDSRAVAEAAGQYIFWRLWSLPFAFATCLFRAFFVATLSTRVLTAGACVLVTSNCLLNWVLIFGLGPVPALGIAGAAIASTLAEIAGFLFFAIWAATRQDRARYGLFAPQRLTLGLQRELFGLGSWAMFDNTVSIVSWLFFFIAVERLGERALAISNIERQLCSLLYLSIVAFGSAVGAVCSNLIGQGQRSLVPQALRRGFLQCAFFMVLTALPVALWPERTLALFTSFPDLVSASLPTHWVMLATFLVTTPAMYLLFVLSGLGCVRQGAIATLASVAVYMLATQALVRLTDNVAIVWLSDFAYYGVTLALSAWFWRCGDWKRVSL